MPKNILQDIKPLTSREHSIKITTEPAPRARKVKREEVEEPVHREPPVIEHYEDTSERIPPRRPKLMLWIITASSLIVLFFALSYLFDGATVTVTPKSKELVLNDTFTAVKNAGAEDLSFEVMAVDDDISKDVEGVENKDVSSLAKGTVVLYNEYSQTSQPLLIDTRLQTPSGKIYKTDKAVTIPGYTMKDGEKVPGSVTIGIHASEPGSDYNITPSDFTIFGFKGTPKYDGFYAKSKGDISGGAVGNVFTIDPTTAEKTKADLSVALRDKLLKKATNQIPPGYVYFDDSIFFTSDVPVSNPTSQTKTITLTESGSLALILFNEKNITAKIADAGLAQYDGNPVSMPELAKLHMQIKDKAAVNPQTATSISFTLDGKATLYWSLDKVKLLASLIGVRKSAVKDVLAQYPTIDTAEVVISPFWKTTLPTKEGDINLIVKEPEPAEAE